MSRYWKTEEVFFDGDEYFDRLMKDIDQAQHYITMEMYIFNDDMLGKKIVAHLINAHQRGVKVQIIVDGVGSYLFFDKLHGIFQKKGILVKMYNPLPFYHPYYGKLNFIRKLQIMSVRLVRLNKRNHRKIVTIDNTIMYTGSFNVTAEHTKYHTDKPWKDMGMRVTGDNVRFAVLNFKKNWKLRDYFRYKKQLKRTLNINWRQSPLRLNHTLFMKRYFYKNFLQKIHKSQNRIWLMTPYFIPKRRLIRALGKAARRGVDVRILISSRTDVEFFRWLQYFYYAYLINKGVKVYQYTDSVLHAKNYIIDDWMTIGSTNLNHRSFIHDLEVDLVVQDPENKKLVEEHFLSSLVDQKDITLEGLKQRPLWDRALSRLFFLFKYWF
ncbi:phospholipase D-like domain-containing protein [Peredibacter starrii]|uniref:Phospholipase D-like domain-containing protein n=1 Tax=Peredibacter starrii TaxID=28202 RepID=A0AAX4HRX2_9BACT|nr:phospholipase D-like domain-containing protein [Peredibacter starrii]WPU66079.1 phospholipase D-like domain-containing protein [Peredibacter starrii]